jgi:hypothetical protein
MSFARACILGNALYSGRELRTAAVSSAIFTSRLKGSMDSDSAACLMSSGQNLVRRNRFRFAGTICHHSVAHFIAP